MGFYQLHQTQIIPATPDEQRIGPYAMWHHEHKIEPVEGGVLMTDIVSYQPPFGFLGAIANSVFIKKQLRAIFDYRTEAMEKMFGKMVRLTD